jgi:hypothetical protein
MTAFKNAFDKLGFDYSPVCLYCNHKAKLVTGEVIYPHRPDLHDLSFWNCANCEAYVGCHKGTTTPMGRLADRKLRIAKMAAHAKFDQLWNTKRSVTDRASARTSEYLWLAGELKISKSQCHIGDFDLYTCYKVVDLVQARIKSQ